MKVFGVFMPYHKNEILDSYYEGYDKLPSYPREYRRVRVFTDKLIQMEVYANTMCPASQIFECEEEDIDKAIEKVNNQFDDENWLEKNVYPFI